MPAAKSRVMGRSPAMAAMVKPIRSLVRLSIFPDLNSGLNPSNEKDLNNQGFNVEI